MRGFAPFVRSKAQAVAHRLASSRFGSELIGGLSQPTQPGGFWNNVSAGLAGGMAGASAYDTGQAQQHQQDFLNLLARTQQEQEGQRLDLEGQRIGEEQRHNKAVEAVKDIPPDWTVPTGSDADGNPLPGAIPPELAGVPPAGRAAAWAELMRQKYSDNNPKNQKPDYQGMNVDYIAKYYTGNKGAAANLVLSGGTKSRSRTVTKPAVNPLTGAPTGQMITTQEQYAETPMETEQRLSAGIDAAIQKRDIDGLKEMASTPPAEAREFPVMGQRLQAKAQQAYDQLVNQPGPMDTGQRALQQ